MVGKRFHRVHGTIDTRPCMFYSKISYRIRNGRGATVGNSNVSEQRSVE